MAASRTLPNNKSISEDIPHVARMERQWGILASAQTTGFRDGLQIGQWRFESERPFEIDSAPLSDVHILSAIISGELDCEFFSDGRRRYRQSLSGGWFNLVRVAERPRAVEYKANCSFLQLYLPDAALQACLSEDDSEQAPIELRPSAFGQDLEIARIGRALHSEMTQPAAGSRMMIDGLTLQLAVHMVRRWSNLTIKRRDSRPLSDWRVCRAVEYMEAHLSENIGISEVAVAVGLSMAHLSGLFRATVGLPPHRWLMNRRVERATELLSQPRRSVTEIAVECGFASSQHLATVFQQRMGTTPSAYRREQLS